MTNELKGTCFNTTFKGPLSGLRQLLTNVNLLSMMKNAFYFMLKTRFVLKILLFCPDFLVM